MTLPASGSMTVADIRAELGMAAGATIVFPDATTRWLAEKPTGNIVIPTDYHSKSAVKIVDNEESVVNQTTTYTFTGVDFGPAATNRTIIVTTHLYTSNSSTFDVTSVTIGGVAATGADAGENMGGPSVSAGIWEAKPSGTSGTIVVNFTSTGFGAQGCKITVISAICASGAASSSNFQQGSGSGLINASASVTVPANGFVVAAGTRGNTNAVSFTNAIEAVDINLPTPGVAVARQGVAFQNRLSAGSRTVTMTGTGTTATGFVVRAYSPS